MWEEPAWGWPGCTPPTGLGAVGTSGYPLGPGVSTLNSGDTRKCLSGILRPREECLYVTRRRQSAEGQGLRVHGCVHGSDPNIAAVTVTVITHYPRSQSEGAVVTTENGENRSLDLETIILTEMNKRN